MQDLEMKQNILKEIMDLMDQKEGEKLKSHPKFMAAKVEVEKPAVEEAEPKEESVEVGEKSMSESEVSPEQLQMLLEQLKDLK